MKRIAFALLSLPLFAAFAACSSSTTVTGTPTGDAGNGGGEDASTTPDATAGSQCSSAREQLLVPVKKTSTGEVAVVGQNGGTRTIYVDASAGGQGQAAKNPRVYVDLTAGARVDVTDETAASSTAWDLALKRTVVFTNSGDAGVGQGGAVQLSKPFASVTAADADAATIASESFFDEECNPKLDAIGAPATTFSDWYEYDQTTNIPTPKSVTYVVKGGTGKRFKVRIKAYDGLPDGGSRDNSATGFFLLEVADL